MGAGSRMLQGRRGRNQFGITETDIQELGKQTRETKVHTIEPHAGGRINLSMPQQVWTFTDDSGLMATARFAGQVVEAITDDAGSFDLMYLGFQAKGYATMDEAKAAAPDFARRVLQRMCDLVGNTEALTSDKENGTWIELR